MSTPRSETVKLKLSDIRERCRDLMEDPETPPELRPEDTDEPEKGRDPDNHSP